MNLRTLLKKIEVLGFELLKAGQNNAMELFKFNVNETTYSFCVTDGEAYGFKGQFGNGDSSFYATANEMLKSAARAKI